MMELCLIGLFLFIRDEQGVFTGIGQAVIMMIATVLTVIYQLLLGNAFASILEYLPAYMENRNDSEGKLKQKCSQQVHSVLYVSYCTVVMAGWYPSRRFLKIFRKVFTSLHGINSIYQASVGMSMRLFNVPVLLSGFQKMVLESAMMRSPMQGISVKISESAMSLQTLI
jgi:hypothetical protein